MANPRNMKDILQSQYFNDIYGEKEPDNLLTFQQFTELKPSLHSFGYGSDELLDSLLPGDLRGWGEGNFEANYGDMVNMPDWGATFGTDYNFPEILGGSASLDAALDAAANTPGGSWMDIELTPEDSQWYSNVDNERRNAILDMSVGGPEALRKAEKLDNILHAAGGERHGVTGSKWKIEEDGGLTPVSDADVGIIREAGSRARSGLDPIQISEKPADMDLSYLTTALPGSADEDSTETAVLELLSGSEPPTVSLNIPQVEQTFPGLSEGAPLPNPTPAPVIEENKIEEEVGGLLEFLMR